MKKIRPKLAGIISLILMSVLILIPQMQVYADPEPDASEDVSQELTEREKTESLDFSSGRILVRTDDEKIFSDPSAVISSYEDLYLLQFDSEEEARAAFVYYKKHASFTDVDTTIMIADANEEQTDEKTDIMTEKDNPFSELSSALKKKDTASYDIALIDTGADDAECLVSLLGDNGTDGNGHGSRMLRFIRGQNPEARVLSIKALDDNGHGDSAAIFAAIEYAKERKVKIINLSMSAPSSSESSVIEEAINDAEKQGILVIGAAGNNGLDASGYIPGSIEAAMIAGSAMEDGVKVPLSNYGETVDYYIHSSSTSEAAAVLSGWLSANQKEKLMTELNRGLIFDPAYVTSRTEERTGLMNEKDPDGIFSAAGDKFNKGSITSKSWSEIKPHISQWIKQNIPYVSPCASLIDWENETAYGLDCSGFVNAMVHLYYDDGKIDYDWKATWFSSGVWAPGLEAAGLCQLKDSAKQAFEKAYDNGTIQDGDIVVFSNNSVRGVHVAIVYGENSNGEVVLAHAYGKQLQKNTFSDVYDWDFSSAESDFYTAGSGAYSYYEVFAGTPRIPEEAGIKVIKKTSETYPRLTVGKEIRGSGADPGRDFSFTAVYLPKDGEEAVTENFTLKGGESRTFICEPGSKYEVSEQDCTEDGYVTDPESGSYSGSLPSVQGKSPGFHFVITYFEPGASKATKTSFTLASGESRTFTAEPGSAYTVREAEPEGNWQTVSDAEQSGTAGSAESTVKVVFKNKYIHDPVAVQFTNTREIGFLKLQKKCSAPELTRDNTCYTLDGSKYAVYAKTDGFSEDLVKETVCKNGEGADEDLASSEITDDGRAGTFYVDADGNGRVISGDASADDPSAMKLPVGIYFVAETARGQNYELDQNIYTVEIKPDEEIEVVSEEQPFYDPSGLVIIKKCSSGDQPAVPPEGAEFTIRFYDNEEGNAEGDPLRTWIIKTVRKKDKGGHFYYQAALTPECRVAGDDFFYDDEGNAVLPVGTIFLEETKPAKGYQPGIVRMTDMTGKEIRLNKGVLTGIITEENGNVQLNTGNEITVFNSLIPDLPAKTSDLSDFLLWAAASVLTVLIFVIALWIRSYRRIRKQNRH